MPIGSLYIVGGATVLGLIVSIPVVFYLNVYLKKKSKKGFADPFGVRCAVRYTFHCIRGIRFYHYDLFRVENFACGRNHRDYPADYPDLCAFDG